MNGRCDIAEIERAVRLILQPGQVTELRALEAKVQGEHRTGTFSGYFDDPSKLAKEAARVVEAKGIYFTPNAVNPVLLARSVNKARQAGKDPTTSDHDIARRLWLLVDCDPARPSGIASTDAEHGLALSRAESIALVLTERSWPLPLVADSGNGAHLLYRIDLPPEDGGLVQRCLAALGREFDDSVVTIDQTTFNPARIWKLYGTLAGKGDPEAAAIGRPHRMSRVLSVPGDLTIVPLELLELLGGRDVPIVTPVWPATRGSFDIDEWIRQHSLDLVGPEPWKGGGRRWVFKVCPWNSDHTNLSAHIEQHASGAISAGCHHNGCRGNDWRSLRALCEGTRAERERSGIGPAPDISAIVNARPDDSPDGERAISLGPADPGPFPERLLLVPGFVSDVMAYNLIGGFRRQPVLALAGGLALLATLTGRKVANRSDTRTNLYMIGLCETSMGKDRAREVNKQILHAAGLGDMAGPEGIASAAGLVSIVAENPAILLQLDEMGRMLQTLNDPRQSHLFNIVSVLMKLFTSSASVFRGDAYADTKRVKTIYQPHATVWGTTTAEAFYDALRPASIQDGFLSRVLVFEGTKPPKFRVDKPELPAEIVNQARFWGDYKPGGNLHAHTPQPLIIETLPEAKRFLDAFDELTEEEMRSLGNPLRQLWPRSTEKADKLAMLYACSENAQAPVVDAQAARWACELVEYLTRKLVYLASRYISENRQESITKRMARIIEAAGPKGLTRTELWHETRWLSKRDREDTLATLLETGEIDTIAEDTQGRSKTFYRHTTFFT